MSRERGESGVLIKPYIEMTKPRIIELLLITAIPATVVARGGWPGWSIIVVVLIGGTLCAGGANVLNQVYDHDIDLIMERTATRPLPTGRVSTRPATVFGLSLCVVGFAILSVGSTLLAGLLALVASGFYVFIYTMILKRSTTQNIVLGGAAGAMPALIGWAAVTGELAVAPWIMFAIIFYWTPPHFWALSVKYEDDYKRAEVPMLTVVAGDDVTFREIIWYSVITCGAGLMLTPVAGLGWIYGATAALLGVWMVVAATKLRSDLTMAMRFFGFTNLSLAGVFLAMMIDRLVGTRPLGGETLVMFAATAMITVGVIAVVVIEATSQTRAEGISRIRQGFEVGSMALFSLILMLVSWSISL